MFATQQFVIAVVFCCLLPHSNHGASIVQRVDTGLQLVKTGEIELKVSDKLIFEMSNPCSGLLQLCYVAESTSDGLMNYENVSPKCPSDSCLAIFNPNSATGTVFKAVRLDSIVQARFQNETKSCPMKTVDGRQKFNFVELPNCGVTIKGAVLLSVNSPASDNDNEVEEDVTKAPKNLKWLLPTVVGVVLFFVFIGVFSAFAYNYYKGLSEQDAAIRANKRSSRRQKNRDTLKSPVVAPTSPATIATPTQPPTNTANVDAKSPTVNPDVKSPTVNVDVKSPTVNAGTKSPTVK